MDINTYLLCGHATPNFTIRNTLDSNTVRSNYGILSNGDISNNLCPGAYSSAILNYGRIIRETVSDSNLLVYPTIVSNRLC